MITLSFQIALIISVVALGAMALKGKGYGGLPDVDMSHCPTCGEQGTENTAIDSHHRTYICPEHGIWSGDWVHKTQEKS